MKVSLITILDNTNYGTYLQALATCLVINRLGYEVEVIRYTRESCTPKGNSRAIWEDRGPLRWFNRCVLHYSKKPYILREKDHEFLKSFVPETREYIGFDDLRNDPPVADIYMTGSDQVWNSFYNRGIDRSFYLDYALEGTKRIAYAASIGMSSIPEEEKAEMTALLKKYSNITVRESSAVELLSGLGINSRVVLDPTLLINKEEWAQIASKYAFDYKEPYLLTYSVEYGKEDTHIKHYAQSIAKTRGLKHYHVTYGKNKSLKCADKSFEYATPDLFLNLMLHASFVVVSSFHGTAFSINFNKPFITVSPKRFNTRIKSLLELTRLESRVVFDSCRPIEEFEDIDYSVVNERLEESRIESIKEFKQLLK